jgi:hypothetical protein
MNPCIVDYSAEIPRRCSSVLDPCIVDYSVEITTRCSFVIEFIIPKFFEGSTCFKRHTKGCKYSLELLMMSGVPLETC